MTFWPIKRRETYGGTKGVGTSVNSVSALRVLRVERIEEEVHFPADQPPSIMRQLPVTMAASSLAR